MTSGLIWDIKRYALHDGPGIRTTVFFKGCPLRCPWCCNPESQKRELELTWLAERCLDCGHCLRVCPRQALRTDDEGRKHILLDRCDVCGLCADQCPGEALVVMGRRVQVGEVLREIAKDGVFWQRSGGGLTLSGGEPLFQPEFAAELIRRYKIEEGGPHISVETCGLAEWDCFERLLPYVDLFLFDIKQMDSERHREYTGADNNSIIDNLVRISESGRPIRVRVPLIPGYTDDWANLERIAELASSLPAVTGVDLLPYHRLGEPKYQRLGREYPLAGTPTLEKTLVGEIKERMEARGLRVRIGG